MKKTLKFFWMAALCLPVLSFTACDNDNVIEDNDGDKIEVLFKDYSDLLGKKYDDVIKKVGVEPKESAGLLEFVVNTENVQEVDTWFFYADQPGVVFEEVVNVDSYLSDELTTQDVVNYLSAIYTATGYDVDEETGEREDYFKKDKMVIVYYEGDNMVSYYDTSKMNTKAGEFVPVRHKK